MKRRELIRRLRECGAEFVREGASHTVYRNPRTGLLVPIPRHAEVNDRLADKILRDAGTR